MKVKELIERLSKLDPDLTVCATCEDADVVADGQLVRPFSVEFVGVADIETSRDTSGRPQMAAVEAGRGHRYALLEITGDF
ncbi:hypothetical protein [Ectopseudomonas mendocina]|uniref:hypothetical protein n=1 Tax=Ectopseudomonas mendocina TaxID=300 RepID=UPI00376EE861